MPEPSGVQGEVREKLLSPGAIDATKRAWEEAAIRYNGDEDRVARALVEAAADFALDSLPTDEGPEKREHLRAEARERPRQIEDQHGKRWPVVGYLFRTDEGLEPAARESEGISIDEIEESVRRLRSEDDPPASGSDPGIDWRARALNAEADLEEFEEMLDKARDFAEEHPEKIEVAPAQPPASDLHVRERLLSDEMVEATARALFEGNPTRTMEWDDLGEWLQNSWRPRAREALIAVHAASLSSNQPPDQVQALGERLLSDEACEAGAGEWPAACVPHLCKPGDPPEFIESQQAANRECVRAIIRAALSKATDHVETDHDEEANHGD